MAPTLYSLPAVKVPTARTTRAVKRPPRVRTDSKGVYSPKGTRRILW